MTTTSEGDILGSDISKDDTTASDASEAEKEGKELGELAALTESTYYILLSLNEPRHGYGIMQETESMSKGRVRLAAGTLYGALNTLCEKGWIIMLPTEDGSRRKEYKLTEKGRKVLRAEVNRLRELADNGERILGEEEK